ncbi:MAG: helix-turn-helix domain-containing protein, partial [Pseudomonadales bacterium]
RLEWIELLEWATELTRPVSISVDDPGKFKSLLYQTEQLESTTYLQGSLTERLCMNIIENILIRIRLLAEGGTSEGIKLDRRIQGAVDYILNHYGEDITVERIADSVNISPSRLSALFREHFGISLIKWRDHIRMEKAKELISHTNLSIGDIAARVGYPDPLYFSRRFNNHFGFAPTSLRKPSDNQGKK